MLKFLQKKNKTDRERQLELIDVIRKESQDGLFIQRDSGCLALVVPVDFIKDKPVQEYAWIWLRHSTQVTIELTSEFRSSAKVAETMIAGGWSVCDVEMSVVND